MYLANVVRLNPTSRTRKSVALSPIEAALPGQSLAVIARESTRIVYR
jgi:hypothetical protein